jgi:hypothetical protein
MNNAKQSKHFNCFWGDVHLWNKRNVVQCGFPVDRSPKCASLPVDRERNIRRLGNS